MLTKGPTWHGTFDRRTTRPLLAARGFMMAHSQAIVARMRWVETRRKNDLGDTKFRSGRIVLGPRFVVEYTLIQPIVTNGERYNLEWNHSRAHNSSQSFHFCARPGEMRKIDSHCHRFGYCKVSQHRVNGTDRSTEVPVPCAKHLLTTYNLPMYTCGIRE